MVAVSTLKAHPKNPQRHSEAQVALLAKIISRTGWRRPIRVSERSGLITAGHCALAAAQLKGWRSVPVDFQPYASDALELADLSADNELARLAETDEEALEALLKELDGDGIERELAGMLAELAAPDQEAEPQLDRAKELQKKWRTKTGQLWKLGKHRVLCGNNLAPLSIEQLAGKETMQLLLTDPPYNIVANKRGKGTGVYQKTNHLATINESFGTSFDPTKFMNRYCRIARNGSVIWFSQGLLPDYLDFARASTLKWDLMFWHKPNSMPAHHNHLLNDTEYCVRMFASGSYFENHLEYCDYHKYFIENVQPGNGHPTPKPLCVMVSQLRLFSRPGDCVLDPFLGSGTTLMACEQLQRRCYGIEIDPGYVAVTLQRFQDATGQKPKL